MRLSALALATALTAAGAGLVSTTAAAAAPASGCTTGASYAVTTWHDLDEGSRAALTEMLDGRGLTQTDAASADVEILVASTDRLEEGGDATVLGAAVVDDSSALPTEGAAGVDWAPIKGADVSEVAAQVDTACGTSAPAEAAADESADDGAAAPAAAAADTSDEDAKAAESGTEEAATDEAAAASTSDATAAGSSTPSRAAAAQTADAVCDDFSTQPEAQASLPANPGLDGDNDGYACESKFGEPTTSTSGGTTQVSAVVATGDKNCKDFASQADAQTFFVSQGGPARDSHDLDRDDDGIACESYAYGSSPRADAVYISSGVPETSTDLAGLAGGLALLTVGAGVGLRARRQS